MVQFKQQSKILPVGADPFGHLGTAALCPDMPRLVINTECLLGVGSEGRPESEVRRKVGVGLTEYTEEGNG